MNRSSLLFLSLATVFASPKGFAQDPPAYDAYSTLLERYVTAEGVQYKAWHASAEDTELLDKILEDFSTIDYRAMKSQEATAFLVNLYNAAMIQAVLDYYPLQSVRSIGFLPFTIFRRDYIALNGEEVSLDTIEKELLLAEFGDPRIHFAVNCASVSCPPLRSSPFLGKVLDSQFDEQATLFANSKHAARVIRGENTTTYSELFKWYDADFPGDDPATYLNQFRKDPLPVGNEVQWIDYDWSLNEAP